MVNSLPSGEPARPEANRVTNSTTSAGRRAAVDGLAMPVLAVLDPHSRLVPPGSVLPSLAQAGGSATVLRHREEGAGIAFGHVGALVGCQAHRRLWPEVLRWCRAVWEGCQDRGDRFT
jgi:hypothetical protein